MPTNINYVLVGNLGPEFLIGAEIPSKITIDEAKLTKLTNTLTADPLTGKITSTVNGGTPAVLDLTPLIKAAETKTTIGYNAATKKITYTGEDGVPAVMDLSGLAMDIFMNAGSYDASAMALTLKDNDATTPDVVINLADLKKVAIANSPSITLSGTGETASPLTAAVKISATAGNSLSQNADGLFVTVPAPTPTTVAMAAGTAPGTIKTTVNGVASADFNIGPSVRQLCDLVMQDAFGVTFGYAFTTNV